MRRILLTSAGLETNAIMQAFLRLLPRSAGCCRALFIPTAAIDADAIAVLPKCMDDLLRAGIPRENIAVFDLHRSMEDGELLQYDCIYFTGGDTRYLLDRINESGFRIPLLRYVGRGGLFLGVSAGSIIAAGNLPGNLGLLAATLSVHQPEGTPCGSIDPDAPGHIALTDRSAILLDDRCRILA